MNVKNFTNMEGGLFEIPSEVNRVEISIRPVVNFLSHCSRHGKLKNPVNITMEVSKCTGSYLASPNRQVVMYKYEVNPRRIFTFVTCWFLNNVARLCSEHVVMWSNM